MPRLTIIFVSLLLLLSLGSLTLSVSAQEPILLLLADYEWAHITIGDTPTESIRFDKIGSDIQLYFHSFNDSSTIYDQLVIYPNQTFQDSLRLLTIHWNGTLTTDNKLLLTLQSITLEPVSLIITKYEATRLTIGHPPMTYVKPIITLPAENQTQQIYDVLLDNEWLVSFDWTWATLENQTLPQLRLYTTDGNLRDTRLITAEMKPVIDYGGVDGVGWIPQILTTQFVKWLLYSGHQITVRPNSGFGYGKPLPYFSVEPHTTKIEPNQDITIRFTLPLGATNFTSNLESYLKYLNQPLPQPEYDRQTQEYTLSFSFNNNAIGKVFTIGIQTVKHGVTYLSETRLQIIQPVWQNLIWSIAAGIAAITIFSIFLLVIVKTKRVKPTPSEAIFRG